jgi:ATP-dependent DNA helicase RecQ
MGVDKHDIHTIVHFDVPKTAEAYIQEAGRAGRDGSCAKAILLWNPKDSIRFTSFSQGSREYEMKKYMETTDCRRQVLLDALGAEQAVCSGCDLCEARWKDLQKKKDRTGKVETDENLVLRFINGHKKLYSKKEMENVLLPLLNEKSRAVCGRNIWDNRSIADLLYQLETAGKIKTCCRPWASKVTFQKDFRFYSLHSRLKQIHQRCFPLQPQELQQEI